MVNGIDPSITSSAQMPSPPDPTKIYNDLAQKVGADDKGITQDDLTTYLKKLQDEGKGDSREAKMISKLSKDFDKLSGGSDTITTSSMQEAFKSGPMGGPGGMGKPPSPDDIYNNLATSVGADDKGISKQNLQDTLDKLNQNGQGDSKEADMLGNMISDFSDVSGGTDYITSDSLQKAMQAKMQQSGPPDQDPSDITIRQRQQTPVDLRVI